MGVLATAEIFLFEDFRLNRREGLSRRDERGIYVPVAIGPRALDVLAVLVNRPGALVRKEEIMAALGAGGCRKCQLDSSDIDASPGPRSGASGRELHPDRRRPGLPFYCTRNSARARRRGARNRDSP
jgi:hypothetical protein